MASWLKAEINSSRFAHHIKRALEHVNASEAIITKPNLESVEENTLRKRLLLLARRKSLKRFPWKNTDWYELKLENRAELASLYTPFGDTWLAFTNGGRRLDRAAAFIASLPPQNDPLLHVKGVHTKLVANIELEPPILITSDKNLSEPFNILEGNIRLVSYYLYADTAYPLSAFVGVSPFLATWAHNGDTLQDIREAFRKQGGTT